MIQNQLNKTQFIFNKNRGFILLFALLLSITSCKDEKITDINLSGTWDVKLDSTNIGISEDWSATKFEGSKIELPGTLDDAGLGKPNTLKPAINNYVMSNLTRKHQYIGKAWYQKEIEIPSAWKGQNVVLSLERIIWESTVYLDGQEIGSANSLIGKHEFEFTDNIAPGKHLLTIVIDNSNKFPNINVAGTRYPDKVNQDMAHAYTNHTQIKWNGILGDIELRALGKNQPKNLQVYPNAELNKLKVTFQQEIGKGENVNCVIKSTSGEEIFNEKIVVNKQQNGIIEFEINRPSNLELWDEFNPNLYNVEVITNSGNVQTSFGYKWVSSKTGDLLLNDKRIFLRGNLECVIFPLTGYPPTDKSDWAKLIKQAKAYGLNHLRFHSWCPPKAAFEAADEAGFYYQVELPHWSLEVGEDSATTEFLKEEAQKIIKDYGNHPSFIFMAMGNELQGDISVLNTMVADLKKEDNRHLYATTAFSFQKPTGTRPEIEDEFFITQWTDRGWIRGQGIFNSKSPHFDADYSSGSAHIEIPLISHEIGQYSVYPDMSEIEKYTGLLEPLNFVAVKQDLEKKGLLELAPDFTFASGKLAALLYKEEIERALKTPSFDGFQLLQLQDFPGQGTALVGLLNAFWESKGVISAEEFSQFNSEMVPLIRFEKAVYEAGETFEASIEFANFFEEKKQETIVWTITDKKGVEVKKGTIDNVDLKIGNNTDLGLIDFSVNPQQAQQLTITVSLKNTKYKNSWNIWVYPKEVPVEPKGIVITTSFVKAAEALKEGKNVLLNPDFNNLEGIEGRFVPVFWSPVHFPNQPATMGVLLDEEHAAFKSFPTSMHTDWQWWDLCINSKSVITDSLDVTPLVRVIDNFVTNHHLSNVFEAKVGDGKLIFSSIDLTTKLNERPVARQLRHSLLNYMESEAFNPSKTIKFDALKRIQLDKSKGSFSTTDIYDE
ncbi:sugar-binding domain-containing protein [Winogradskyella thalassocola]|uniref:Glycosyl hydrolases family 2 n=1 Tax=Winogradskyella thalassocola TaxID=262004 RepID=A0A1G7WFG4_9FLAO|nr:sugar-binding domain-containing protein [Winogradskyella thalassocola]SDG70489.1 Glycosyl hydrolases family 2 [Winogradskyella thalassocola]